MSGDRVQERTGDGAFSAANDGRGGGDPIGALLREWASSRDVELAPGAALAAADAALAEVHRRSFFDRRWFPGAVFGGSIAAALGGVLLLVPAADLEGIGSPAQEVAGAPAAFTASAGAAGFAGAAGAGARGRSALAGGGEVQLAGAPAGPQLAASDFGPSGAPPLDETFPAFDAPPDDLLMTSHVFTTRPEEELIY